jgi:hypothetical protein
MIWHREFGKAWIGCEDHVSSDGNTFRSRARRHHHGVPSDGLSRHEAVVTLHNAASIIMRFGNCPWPCKRN